MNFNAAIVDAHKQKYPNSCIPSAVELVLKLKGRVDKDYFELQDAWKFKSDGNFSDFHNQCLFGLRFIQLFNLTRGATFPLGELFNKINTELEANRYVVISLGHPTQGWHMYIIYKKDNLEFAAFSKNGEQTISTNKIRQIVTGMGGTDILTYQDEENY
jgi:hypothetical protein